MPKVFISYSWENEEHKEWVKSLVDELLGNGIDATLDQYDLSLGDRLPQFMETSISSSDYVLIICTPEYKQKADSRKGGVGYEGHIISGELLTDGNERKFIPVIRKGTFSTAVPNFLKGKLGIDLSNEKWYEDNFKDLIATIWGEKKKPSVKSRRASIGESVESIESHYEEPIHITGIITDKVTVPKMDGTRGSALYKIPFKLSKNPSYLWKQLFVEAWNMPPRFTTMHRPGIARVVGDEIVLDGTTIEEVRDYHRETLKLCVEVANKKEADILEKQQIEEQRKKDFEERHHNAVETIADSIEF